MRTDFKTALIMILCFFLLLMTILGEVESYLNLSDFGVLIVAVVSVSVIPAIGGAVFTWLNAEKEPEEERETLIPKRKRIVLSICAVIMAAVLYRVFTKYGGSGLEIFYRRG